MIQAVLLSMSVLAFSPDIELDPNFKAKPSHIFGTASGDKATFECPVNSYVNLISSSVTDQLTSIEFSCSDNRTQSTCFGVNCETGSTKLPRPVYGSYSSVTHPVKKTLSHGYGFNDLSIEFGDEFVTGLSTEIRGLELQMIPDSSYRKGVWAQFPDDDDIKSANTAGKPLVSGFNIWTNAKGILALQPIYVASKGDLPTDFEPYPRYDVLSTKPKLKAGAQPKLAENDNLKGKSETTKEFKCADGSYLTSIEGLLNGTVSSVSFGCSDQTKSECFGDCNPVQGTSRPKVAAVLKSEFGFNKMEFYKSTQTLIGFKSTNAASQFMDNLPEQNAEGKWYGVAASNARFVGFSIDSSSSAINSLQPIIVEVE